MERSRLDLYTDRIITGLLFAIVLAGPLLMGGLRAQDFFWIEVLTLCAGVLAIIRLCFMHELKAFVPAIFWWAMAFTIYAVARYATADLEYVARKELIWVLTYLIIFTLAVNHLREPRRVITLFLILLVLAMGMSLFAVRQHITGTNQVWHLIRPSYMFRGSGTFIYPNHFAGFVELLLPFGIASLFLGPFSVKAKLGIGYCVVWLLVGLYVSLSRAGWVAAVLGFLVLLPLILRNRKSQIWGFAVALIVLLAGLGWELKTGQIRQRFENFTGEGITDVAVRRSIWKAAWKVWRQEPVFGSGPNHFDYRFRPYRDPIMQARPGRAHNDYLDLLAGWGVAGAMLILAPLALFFWSAAKEWVAAFRNPDEPPTQRRLVVIGGTTGIISILIHALADYQMHVPANAILTIVMVAVVLVQLEGEAQGHWKKLIKSRWLVAGSVLAILVVIGFEAQKSLRERRLLDLAAQQAGPEKIQTLKAAFALEPNNFETAYWIGECYRLWSWDGGDDYRQLAEEAMKWFGKASALNRFDPLSPMRLGMCLDWLKQHETAESYYQRAMELDPNNYYVIAHFAWHFFQKGDYAEAKRLFIRSWGLNSTHNPITLSYFKLLENISR